MNDTLAKSGADAAPSLLVPFIPENAPFSLEQRAYLNGFLAGLFARVPASSTAAPSPQASALKPLTILWGSQTGTSETLAKRVARDAGKRGFAPTLHDLATYPTAQLASEERILVITSTYGDGEPPDNAKGFHEFIHGPAAPELKNTTFSVCALGDSSYAKFCAFGKSLDARFEALGARRACARTDCDVDYEAPFATWLSEALAALEGTRTVMHHQPVIAASAPVAEPAPAPAATAPAWSKSHPFPAPLLENRRLSNPGSAKDVRHIGFELGNSGLQYEPGDALGVIPTNDPQLVEELLGALHATGDETVTLKEGGPTRLREALSNRLEITRIPKPLLEHFARATGDSELQRLTAPDANGELTRFLWGREVIDLLLTHPSVPLPPDQFVGFLRKLQPRLYSIASSPRRHPGEVHLTIGTVRYESLGRARRGVCSTFLADRVSPRSPVPVFVHSNKAFRPPEPSTPLIMVGPGTGIAPFRAFLEDRQACNARGRNWLFFGDQRASTDFLYREEIEAFRANGILHRLDLAWSRDQGHKVYVQDRMREAAKDIWAWLEEGAAFYVCGDASRMAKDVDAALHEVVQTAGGKTPEESAAYIRELQSAKRYRRDVY